VSTLRSDSGDVDDDTPFVSLLYSLLRDYVQPGNIERVVYDIEEQYSKGHRTTRYTNGWLAKYAQNIAERLRASSWTALTDEQRLRLIQTACVGCGTLKKPCHCMNDE
jgi:hypothetical protein